MTKMQALRAIERQLGLILLRIERTLGISSTPSYEMFPMQYYLIDFFQQSLHTFIVIEVILKPKPPILKHDC